MCGIVGWAGPGARPFSAAQFELALHQLVHRGPDDQGIWTSDGITLGHRRLSIIDLSSAGHQPMHSTSRRTCIVFNGEIYNYVELRAELINAGVVIAGGSDTGVLLEAIEIWDLGAFQRLNGMWAFAVWDSMRRRMILCRDRFGVKPLYYRMGDDGLAFASEPKALLAMYPQNRRIARDVLFDFLANNDLLVSNNSFYEGIQMVPPGHCAIYEPDRHTLRIERYWDYPLGIDESMSAEQAVGEFQSLFEDSVRIRLRSDVPVGLTLSGGLDSSAILASSSAAGLARPTCFTSTFGDGELGELNWAQRASAVVGAKLTQVPAFREQWMSVLRDVVWHMDGPGYSPAVFPLWCLMKRARAEGVPVILEGQGADEALAGYPQYSVLSLLEFLRGRGPARTPSAIWSRISGLHGTFSFRWAIAWLIRETSPSMLQWHRSRVGFNSLMREGIRPPMPTRKPVMPQGDSVRQRLLQEHSSSILPGLLHYGDAVSMAHSIETRQPYMDYRLVEWMFRLPTRFKIRNGESKWVLREYLRSHGMRVIGDRRDKQGYSTPIAKWLASDENRDVERGLVSGASPLTEWIDPKKLARLFQRHRSGALAADHQLYKLISTQTWINRCIDQREPA